jgi:large subunit ribosomal protein L32
VALPVVIPHPATAVLQLVCSRWQLFASALIRGHPPEDASAGQRLPALRLNQEPIMAVQQNKKSPSKRGMHRSHNAVAAPGIAVEATTGEVHLRHHISPNGFYRGRKVLKTKADA